MGSGTTRVTHLCLTGCHPPRRRQVPFRPQSPTPSLFVSLPSTTSPAVPLGSSLYRFSRGNVVEDVRVGSPSRRYCTYLTPSTGVTRPGPETRLGRVVARDSSSGRTGTSTSRRRLDYDVYEEGRVRIQHRRGVASREQVGRSEDLRPYYFHWVSQSEQGFRHGRYWSGRDTPGHFAPDPDLQHPPLTGTTVPETGPRPVGKSGDVRRQRGLGTSSRRPSGLRRCTVPWWSWGSNDGA